MADSRKPPLVIAHRGASGYRPEHTLAAYELAIEQGADFIEPDLVCTRDGVLVVRHENELSGSTDVADRPAFADRRCRKQIDGESVTGWFCEDFSLDEIKSLRARERIPALRPGNAAYDGRFEVPTFAEVLALLRRAESRGRRVGVYPETKHPTFFAAEGRHQGGEPIGRSLGAMLLAELQAAAFTEPDRVFIQSFEVANLLELEDRLMPAAGLRFPLVQLLGRFESSRPWDIAWHDARGDDLSEIYGGLGDALPQGLGPRCRTGDFTAPAALRWLRANYASAIGPAVDDLLPRGPGGEPGRALAAAQAAGLAVHPYTLRVELGGEPRARRLIALGVDGFFIDQPDLGVALVREAFGQR